MREKPKVLGLKESQILAVKLLIEVSVERALNAQEYRHLQSELQFGLANLLEMEEGARNASLKLLYLQDPKLFSEHKIRKNNKGINALIAAYGPNYPDEIKEILKSQLPDEKVLEILQTMKPSLDDGDLGQMIVFAKKLKGTDLEAWSQNSLPQAFIRMNPAQTH